MRPCSAALAAAFKFWHGKATTLCAHSPPIQLRTFAIGGSEFFPIDEITSVHSYGIESPRAEVHDGSSLASHGKLESLLVSKIL